MNFWRGENYVTKYGRFETQVPGAHIPGVRCAGFRCPVLVVRCQVPGTRCLMPGARDNVARDHVSGFRD